MQGKRGSFAVFLRDGVLRAEHHGRNGENVRELDVAVGVVFDNGEWREARNRNRTFTNSILAVKHFIKIII